MDRSTFFSALNKHASGFHPVIRFNKSVERISALDLSKTNQWFTDEIYSSTENFSAYIEKQRTNAGAKFLIGGYREIREMYRRSKLFDKDKANEQLLVEEPRSLHLGMDIWGEAGTSIYAALGGMVHSFANNDHFGDYGATIILQHQIAAVNFYTLYGHLSIEDISKLRKGKFISRGEPFAHFGIAEENGNWPPHLHFQVILDMGNYEGDYPGVCKISEAEKYIRNSPDPDLILQLNHFIHQGSNLT